MVLDIKQEVEKFLPVNLDTLTGRSSEIPDNIRNSIFLYNKALESIRIGSEDIAVIELKKAVSMNPDFCEAMNLLGVCYSYMNEKEKAVDMFRRVMEVESNSIKAMNYIEMMDSADKANQGPAKKGRSKAKPKKPEPPVVKEHMEKAGPKANPGKNHIIKYIIGFAIGALLVFILMLPKGQSGGDIPADNDISDTSQVAGRTPGEDEEALKLLQEENGKLKDELAAKESELQYFTYAMKLFEIDGLASEGKWMDAAESLMLLNGSQFRNFEKQKFDTLYAEVMPQAAGQAYVEGKNLYDAKDFTSAIDRLSRVERYFKDYERADAALYYLARSYYRLKESRKALDVFNQLLAAYPQSVYSTQHATPYIRALQGEP